LKLTEKRKSTRLKMAKLCRELRRFPKPSVPDSFSTASKT
jgi:hypothetical protein